jgi:hypothetical protein
LLDPGLSAQRNTASPESAQSRCGSANPQRSAPSTLRGSKQDMKLQHKQNAGLIADLCHDLESLGKLRVRGGESRGVYVKNAEASDRVGEDVTVADLAENVSTFGENVARLMRIALRQRDEPKQGERPTEMCLVAYSSSE